jgi:hypothetical protein
MSSMDAERAHWATFFLARLERLCHLEERFVSPPDVIPEPRRLVNKAIFATYCECVRYGRKSEAERVLATCPARAAHVEASPA